MTDLDLLKQIVIAWDADQDEEFDEALDAARERCGFQLAADADQVLDTVKAHHADLAEYDDGPEED